MSRMTGQPPIVSFRNVTKSYDGKTLVVRNLDLDIRRGEFLTLLGPSGSGKTTCLMMFAGFETAPSGEILIDGQAGRPSCRRTSATSASSSRITRSSRI